MLYVFVEVSSGHLNYVNFGFIELGFPSVRDTNAKFKLIMF